MKSGSSACVILMPGEPLRVVSRVSPCRRTFDWPLQSRIWRSTATGGAGGRLDGFVANQWNVHLLGLLRPREEGGHARTSMDSGNCRGNVAGA
jgi:hypothetical protein